MARRAAALTLTTGLLGTLALSSGAAAVEFFDGRIELHGSFEEQLRTINPDWKRSFDLTQWKHALALELEISIAPDGFLIFDDLSAFARGEVSYDCVWTRACGLFRSADAYGDRANVVPSKYTNGKRGGYVGDVRVEGETYYHPGGTDRLIGLRDAPPFEILGPNISFADAFRPLLSHRFAVHQLAVTTSSGDSSGIDSILLPWRPRDRIDALASLASVDNTTAPRVGLPLRPSLFGTRNGSGERAGGLYVPSPGLLGLLEDGHDLSRFDQNFSQNELEWNLGASQQDEWFLREAYLDASLFEGRLSLRIGKQTVIWGKTELFRNQDQINPVDLAVSTLPSLEESRIPLWALRAIYSFYDVGPLKDVRAELVWLFDDFEPTDLGRCGEPYAPLPVCTKTAQLFIHGALGAGIAGEVRPPNWWNSWKGHEIGGRIEFRYEDFSFAISDFWHFEDSAHPRVFHRFERKVDPMTGRPLASSADPDAPCTTDLTGDGIADDAGCLQPGASGPNNALQQTPMNRQLFDVICRSSLGFFATLDPDVCALSVTNSDKSVTVGGLLTLPIPVAISAILAGEPLIGAGAAQFLAGGVPVPLVTLNMDPNDGAGVPGGLSSTLTDQQEALLGCGAFYGTSCDTTGADLFNAEASVVFQAWPSVRAGSPVATRWLGDRLVRLPGARFAPGTPLFDPTLDAAYSSLVDGTPPAGFSSEMEALSTNALSFIVALDLGDPDPAFPDCSLMTPLSCPTVQDFMSVTQTTRPEMKAGGNGRFGRRDFAWAGAGELVLEYEKVNTLGFAMDFAEDRTGTNWGMELTWTPDRTFASSETLDRLDESDRLALTISVDRPTFIHFLNESRTFFFNMQWFFEYMPGYVGGRRTQRGFEVNGPWTQLGTFTVQTGYFQDRLQPALTFVYDVQTASGAIIAQSTYRMTANFSVTFGVNNFFGRPQGWINPLSLGALGESNQTWERERFDRLNAVRERDELFMRLRYTF